MSSRLKGGQTKKSHKGLVRETENRSAAIEKQFLPSTYLDPAQANAELKGVGAAPSADSRIRDDKGHFPIHATQKGHWTQPSGKDTDKSIKMGLVQQSRANGAGNNNGPFGQIMQSDDDVSWMKEKKLQDENWAQLRLLGYLIDPLQPESQDVAYAIAPELKSYPEQVHMENLALQEALRVLLRDGKLGGKEDNALIYHILRPDFELPLHPLWDPDGLLTDAALSQAGITPIKQQMAAARGLFSPRNWSGKPPANQPGGIHSIIKVMILKRLYPGLRFKSVKWISDNVLANLSPSNIGGNPANAAGGDKTNSILGAADRFDFGFENNTVIPNIPSYFKR